METVETFEPIEYEGIETTVETVSEFSETLETSVETDITDSELFQNLDNIEQGIQLIAGLLLFFFVWSIFNWLYSFFKSFF
ncbi:MAG: hypothetical protein ACI4JM_12685 [Oscillospiraceae bacterium]